MTRKKLTSLMTIAIAAFFFISCSQKGDKQGEEQIIIKQSDNNSSVSDSSFNSVIGNATMKQIATFPNKVILTGLNDHRLVSVYKSKQKNNTRESLIYKYSYNSDQSEDETSEHFMPGIDILFGYNLLNIAHYDLKTEKVNFLFTHPVLIKTIYYPSFVQDSLDKQPINRNYYLISVYDEDTNKDTLINKRDLRRFFHFDATGGVRTQLIPSDYSVMHSQYDSKNDVVYVFARQDENKNGTQESSESIHVFWFNLKTPEKAKLMY